MKNNNAESSGLWSIRYRPTRIEEFVFSEDNNSNVNYLKEVCAGKRRLGNILLYGPPGTGKTTLALILTKQYETLFINASDENGVDVIRNKVKEFALFSSSKQKAIIFDESDYLSNNAQAVLRNFIESNPSTSFVFTANFIDRLIDPLISRVQAFQLQRIPKLDMYSGIKLILEKEQVQFKPEVLVEYIKFYYPDYRKILNEVQKNCNEVEEKSSSFRFVLTPLNSNTSSSEINSYGIKYEFIFSQESGISKIRQLLSRDYSVDELFLYCIKKITTFAEEKKIENEEYVELIQCCSEHYFQSKQVSYPEVIMASFILKIDEIIKRVL